MATHIKKSLPNSKITWLVEPKWVELIDFHPSIDNVIVFNRVWNAFGVIGLYRKLKQQHFDITLDLQRHLKSGFFSFLSRSKRRIGFNRNDSKELNWIFNNEHIDFFGDDLPKFLHYLKFTQHLGLPKPDVIDFGFSEFDPDPYLPDDISSIKKPFISVVIGSSWQSKDWFFEHYVQLISNILASGKYVVVLLGDCSQKNLSESISAEVNSNKLINMVNKTSLRELAAILKKADAGVGPDSGPGHIAAAVGTPYVTLFGPTPPARVAPYGCEHLVVQTSAQCAPCNKKRCADHEDHCMRLITATEVFKKLDEVLL
ncbi:MAG: glycosyltransferase family 9 protein [Desulfobacterales bacterium]|nr:glycosyltransferase family 9 protein [Desulfobacterales bacterium]